MNTAVTTPILLSSNRTVLSITRTVTIESDPVPVYSYTATPSLSVVSVNITPLTKKLQGTSTNGSLFSSSNTAVTVAVSPSTTTVLSTVKDTFMMLDTGV